jgi:hypothetical protein
MPLADAEAGSCVLVAVLCFFVMRYRYPRREQPPRQLTAKTAKTAKEPLAMLRPRSFAAFAFFAVDPSGSWRDIVRRGPPRAASKKKRAEA